MSARRQSLAHRTGILTGVLALGGIAAYFIITRTIPEPPTVTLGQLLLVLYIFFGILLVFFVTHVLNPLQKVARQMEAALSGKEYEKLKFPTHHADELHLSAEFFNTVLETLEKVSGDIEDNKRLTTELGFAGKLQRHLLPKKAPRVPGLEVTVKTKPATEVGGDNFDIISLPKSTLFYIGDATGHGFPAGLVMSMVNVLIHTFASLHENPVEILTKVNQFLKPKLTSTMFMTLAMLRWDHADQKLYYTGCGHEHILIYRAATKQTEAVKTGGLALGLTPDVSKVIQEKELNLQPDDVVLLYTDGLTEAKNESGEMYGLDRLKATVGEHAYQGSTDAIFRGVSRDFAKWVGRSYTQADDATLMVLKYNFKGVKPDGIRLTVDRSGIDAIERPNWDWES